jgi:hypothetical protein
MMSRVIVVAVVVMRSWIVREVLSVGFAHDDGKLPVDRSQHETDGNERTQAQHRQH